VVERRGLLGRAYTEWTWHVAVPTVSDTHVSPASCRHVRRDLASIWRRTMESDSETIVVTWDVASPDTEALPSTTEVEAGDRMKLLDDVGWDAASSTAKPASWRGQQLPWRARQWARLLQAAALFFVITLEYTTYSFLLPFFPLVVERKGVAAAVSGTLFAGYAVSLVAAAALTGLVLMRYWSAKTLVVVFLLANAVVTGAMTVLPALEGSAFTVAAIALRALQGAAAGVVETAVVPILFRMYPAHLGRINGA